MKIQTKVYTNGMEKKSVVSIRLEDNIQSIERIFHEDMSVKKRRFANQKQPALECCLFYVDGMVNSVILNQHIIQPIIENQYIDMQSKRLAEDLAGQVIMASEVSFSENLEDMIQSMIFGDALLFMEGCEKGLVIPVKSWSMRGLAEPDGEKVMRGPREGFNENLLVNLALLRRKVCNPNLRYKFMLFGKQTHTNACLCYIEGLANPKLISELEKSLAEVDIDGVLSASYIAELIQKSVLTPFKVTGGTERPDTTAGKILEGRAALIIDGTPVALIVPHLFIENFQNLDDYYQNAFYASFSRFLRLAGFLVTTLLPGLYLALVTFHQEMMPAKVLINISQTRGGMPFSTLVEMLALLVIFELIREGGSKIPSNIGQSLSIVGGLVLGQAAVSAKFVSVPVVIIVALTGITGLMIPYLSGPATMLRFAFVFLAWLSGFYGILLGSAAVILHLCTIDCFGVPYMSTLTYSWKQLFQDSLIRTNWRRMKYRPRFLAPHNKVRQGQDGGSPTSRADAAEGDSANKKQSHTNHLFLLLCLLTTCAFLSGCGGREVDTLSIVAGISIDKKTSAREESARADDTSGEYILCAEILDSGAENQEPTSRHIRATGGSVAEAILNGGLYDHREIYWPHAELMVIGKNLASADGIADVLETTLRHSPARLSSYLVLSDLETAEEVLNLQTQTTGVQSFDLGLYVNTASKLGGAYQATSRNVINSLYQEGVCVVMPIVSKVKIDDTEQAYISGTGVFKGDRFIGALDEQETLYLLLLRGKAESAMLNIRFDQTEEGVWRLNEQGAESLSVVCKNPQVRFDPGLTGSSFTLNVSVTLRASLAGGSLPVRLDDPSVRRMAEDLISAYVKENCLAVYQQVVALQTDAFGFGTRIKKRYPREWEQLVSDWANIDFEKLTFDLQVKSKLSEAGNIEGDLKL